MHEVGVKVITKIVGAPLPWQIDPNLSEVSPAAWQYLNREIQQTVASSDR